MRFVTVEHPIDDEVIARSTAIGVAMQKIFPDNIAGQLSTVNRALCILAHYHGVDEDSLLDNVSSMLLHIDSTTTRE